MLENENELKQEPSGGMDHFSRFMFGNHPHREPHKKGEDNSQEFPEQNIQASLGRTSNRKDDWLFGFREKGPPASPHTNLNQIENLLNNIDLFLLMETIDMFVATSKQFKPLLNDLTPYFQRLAKKFKKTE
ncbi:hypothetical protein IEC97_21510 [Neobacillus cucumis]|uniref:hypothetical protein n=1 Tax=Neobacillus cucumis TaxID=1740721 RepID=UPI0018E01159|nr:hypothetical protein [Neobacillus cucumis]MBI0579941.1 hypothetical protein [Neobacillus cucumis]